MFENAQVIREHIAVVNARIKMPEEPVGLINRILDRILADEDFLARYRQACADFFADANDEAHGRIDSLADEKGVDRNLLALTFCEMFSAKTLEKYRERLLPEDVFYDSCIDLRVWSTYFFQETGKWGLRLPCHAEHQLRLKMFRLGRLQFHLIGFSEGLEYEHAGVHVRGGDRVINIHIPEDGPLSRAARLDSYMKAYDFFTQTGNAVFVCDTWLFYPRHVEFLPPKSNIRDFMSEFTLVAHSEYDWTRWDNSWRVYGFLPSYDLDKLPRNTGLQRAYADWFAQTGKAGSGQGVMIFDGKRII